MNKQQLNFDLLSAKDAQTRFAFLKNLMVLAEKDPNTLLPVSDQIAELLHHKNSIFQWTAIGIIGQLAAADKENITAKWYPELIKMLHCGKLITCNSAIAALGKIAAVKPEWKSGIIKEFIAISGDTFETEECKAISMGKVILEFEQFPEDIKNNKDALYFIEEAGLSQRNATRKKAEHLLKRLNIMA